MSQTLQKRGQMEKGYEEGNCPRKRKLLHSSSWDTPSFSRNSLDGSILQYLRQEPSTNVELQPAFSTCSMEGGGKCRRIFQEFKKGPAARRVIGPEGGQVSICGNVLTIPEGALHEQREIEMGILWEQLPRAPPSKLEPPEIPITATISCKPSGLKFLKKVTLAFRHCLIMSPCMYDQLQVILHHSKEDDKPLWHERHLAKSSYELTATYVSVDIADFCFFKVTLPNGSKVDAKLIQIVPYSTPSVDDTNQRIRLHIFDDREDAEQKVQEDEEELNGQRHSVRSRYPFQFNCGNLLLRVMWLTPGWNHYLPDIVIPFNAIWYGVFAPCELHFSNEAGSHRFRFQLEVCQDGNPSIINLIIANNTKAMDSNVKPIIHQVSGERECRSDFVNHQTRDGPSIVAPPEVHDDVPQSLGSPGHDVNSLLDPIAQEVAGIHSPGFSLTRGNSFPSCMVVQNNYHLRYDNGGSAREYQFCPTNTRIIPYHLKQTLAILLGGDDYRSNWVALAKVIEIQDASEIACTKNSIDAALYILETAEQRRKFNSLEELKEIFRHKELQRDDLVDLVDKELKKPRRCCDTQTKALDGGSDAEETDVNSQEPWKGDVCSFSPQDSPSELVNPLIDAVPGISLDNSSTSYGIDRFAQTSQRDITKRSQQELCAAPFEVTNSEQENVRDDSQSQMETSNELFQLVWKAF